MVSTKGAPRTDDGRAERQALAKIESNPDFQVLVAERSRFGWTLSIVVTAVYLVFIALVAFDRGLMATKVGEGPMSLGIVLGLVVIVFAFAVTGIYVVRANSRFDVLTARIKGGR